MISFGLSPKDARRLWRLAQPSALPTELRGNNYKIPFNSTENISQVKEKVCIYIRNLYTVNIIININAIFLTKIFVYMATPSFLKGCKSFC